MAEGSGPARRKPVTRPPERASLPRRIAGTMGRALRRKPGVALVTFAFVTCTGLVVWNATMQQGNRHPAPLFTRAMVLPEPPRRVEIAVAPLPVPRPDVLFAAPTPGAEPLARPAPEMPLRTATADPIGALIRGQDPVKGAEPRVEPQKVAVAQKALLKLGYGPLRPDGIYGAGTRQAVERFERDRNLPVTGTLVGRTARQLASSSGLEIE